MPRKFSETISGKVFQFLKEHAYLKGEITVVKSDYIAEKVHMKKFEVRDAKWWLKQQDMIIDAGPGKIKLNTTIQKDKKRCELICGKYYGAKCDKDICPLKHLLISNGKGENINGLYDIEFSDDCIKSKNIPFFKNIRKERVIFNDDILFKHRE